MSGARRYVVGVRALCEFTAKRGDLDRRFTPSPTAQEGIAGHRLVASRRDAGYRTELALSADLGALTVRGRADGYDASAGVIEEIKTHRGAVERLPANHRALHDAQVRVYAALLCRQQGLDSISTALVYLDIGTQQETRFVQRHAAVDLQRELEARCEAFVAWSEQELAHAGARDAALSTLRFPHPSFRTGQRELAEAVYRAARSGRCLIAQAPTGIGKTMATLFPLLKAWPAERFDKVFFLTAKGSGRGLALDALARLEAAEPGLPLRTVELVAREKSCEHPDRACHGDSCPLARGFYDRLPAARQSALAVPRRLGQAALREVALQHGVCPYYLGQELVRWSDVVIADYNHYFDLNAVLHGLTLAEEWKVAVLADEAHNLLDRARTMYSAQLDRRALQALRKDAPALIARGLARLGRRWSALQAAADAPYRVLPEVPAEFIGALQQLGTSLADHFAEHPDTSDAALLSLYFDVLHFLRVHELFGPHTMVDLQCHEAPGARLAGATLCLRNMLPAPHLHGRFASARTVVLFSATLTPVHFHCDTLGLPENVAWLDVASPFDAEQLSVRVAGHVSTRYADRDRSLAPIAAIMARQFRAAPGNYLAFFSSFEYLEKVATRLAQDHPEIPLWRQARGMAAEDRGAFMARFTESGCGVGFAVLGGVFGEGIDLPGRRLIGAFVATLGLPPLDPVHEELRRRMEQRFGSGYEYAYLYPGLQKVVQAVGRVIRTETDRGVVHLIDDRFQRPQVRRLLPAWWRIGIATTQMEGDDSTAGFAQSGMPYESLPLSGQDTQ